MKAAEKKGKPAVGQALDENYKYKYENMRTTNTNMWIYVNMRTCELQIQICEYIQYLNNIWTIFECVTNTRAIQFEFSRQQLDVFPNSYYQLHFQFHRCFSEEYNQYNMRSCVSLVCGAPVQQCLHLPPSCRVWTRLQILHSFHNPTRLCWQKCLIINTHTGTNLVLYVVKKESVYILVVHRRLLSTIVCTYTIGYTYILLYEHTLTMVENTFVIQQVPIDWPALFSSTN